MKLLIIKLSSMGDVIHAMPAVSDIYNNLKNVEIDWLVDSSFQDIPLLHGNVKEVFTIGLRDLKKQKTLNKIKKIITTLKLLKTKQYDYVLDLQGLWKSAIIARYLSKNSYGFSWNSARDKWATLCYKNKITVSKEQHAVKRLRELVAKSLQYNYQLLSDPNSNIILTNNSQNPYSHYKYVVFITNTTWPTKEWPMRYWQNLAAKFSNAGYKVFFPWGSDGEYRKVTSMVQKVSGAIVLPRLSISKLASVLRDAVAAIAVDTGLAHLSAACNTPTLGLYGATSITKSAPIGPRQYALSKALNCAPCLKRSCKYVEHNTDSVPCMLELSPEEVWEKLQRSCLVQ